MSFEIVESGVAPIGERLPDDACSISKSGTLTLRKAALESVSIKERAIVLADAGTLRLAIRPVGDGESSVAVRVCPVDRCKGSKRVQTGKYTVNAARALKHVGIEPVSDAAGRYVFIQKDNMLIVDLKSASVSKREARRLSETRASLPPGDAK